MRSRNEGAGLDRRLPEGRPGSSRAAFLARVREIAEEYRRGLGPTASMAEIFAALREYDRRRPQAPSHEQPTNWRPRP